VVFDIDLCGQAAINDLLDDAPLARGFDVFGVRQSSHRRVVRRDGARMVSTASSGDPALATVARIEPGG
jgi:hypothetical protein